MSSQDTKIQELLVEFQEQRRKLKDMVTDLEKLKSKIDTLFPEN